MNNLEKVAGRVTVAIPTYNRSELVSRAVSSAIAQTYKNLEVVVSDNCSSDDTVARLRNIPDSRIRLLEQSTNIGMVANFNACLAQATGEFFVMLSDDDILEPTAIERLVKPLLESPLYRDEPVVGMAWCPCHIVNSQGHSMWVSDGGPEKELTTSFLVAQFNGDRGPRFCSVMIRTADAIAVGGYDEERYGPICDMGNWTRVAIRYSYVFCVNEPLARYTMHSTSGTSQAVIGEWVKFAANLHADLVDDLGADSTEVVRQKFILAASNYISNTIVTILLQLAGKPGNALILIREALRWRQYIFTRYVAGRAWRDGRKIFRLRKKSELAVNQ